MSSRDAATFERLRDIDEWTVGVQRKMDKDHKLQAQLESIRRVRVFLFATEEWRCHVCVLYRQTSAEAEGISLMKFVLFWSTCFQDHATEVEALGRKYEQKTVNIMQMKQRATEDAEKARDLALKEAELDQETNALLGM